MLKAPTDGPLIPHILRDHGHTLLGSEVPCMDGARGAREESDVFANRSGAAMYPAFECGRFGRWP